MIIPDWCKEKQPRLEDLTDWCQDNQIGLSLESDTTFRLGWGFYDHKTRSILIPRKLPRSFLLATLGHETFHAANSHNGHQSSNIESKINRVLAEVLISRVEYAFWEEQYNGNPGAIAAALECPMWLIKAYQETLKNT